MRTRLACGVVFFVACFANAATVTVTMTTGHTFQPRSVVINAGDTVRWVNPAGGDPHSVVADDASFTSPTINGGGEFSLAFPTPRTLHYHCGFHGTAGGGGMSGTLFIGNRVQHDPKEEMLSISAWEFTPFGDPSVLFYAGDQYRYGSGFFVAPIHLPTGSQITGFEVTACDNTLGPGAFTMFLDKCIEELPCAYVTAVSNSGIESPGCGYFSSPVVNEVVDNVGASYTLTMNIQVSSPAIKFRSARLFYRKPVSFGPASATFTDVPTTHPFFKYIEALAAAGITGGCSVSPPQYCPDSPLTRGQMAVFLSIALGLQWAN